MTDALSALAAGLLGTLASVATQRFISARHPGLRSLSRWVMVASMVAGAMLAGVTALVGVFTTLRAGGVVEVACAVVVLTQIGGWLLFLKWLRPSLSIRPTLQRLYPVRTRLPLLLPQRSEGIWPAGQGAKYTPSSEKTPVFRSAPADYPEGGWDGRKGDLSPTNQICPNGSVNPPWR